MLRARVKVGPVLPLFLVAHFSHHVATGALVPLLPWLREAFELDYTRSGLLVSAFSLTYGIAQLPMASIADRSSKTMLVGTGLVGVAVGAIAMGLSPSFYLLLAFLILVGFFGATYHAPASSFLSQWFSQEARGRALGTHLIGGSSSLLFTPVAAVLIAKFTGDWRYSFIALAFPALVVGFFVAVLGRKYEKASLASIASAPRERISIVEIVRLIGVLLAIAMVTQLVSSGIMTFLPLYLVDKHQVPKELAGMIVGLVAGAGIVGGPLGGSLSDRIGRKPVIMLSVILTGPMVYLLTVVPFGPLMIAVILVYGLVMTFRAPTIESLIADTVPWHRRATVLGIYFFLSQETAGIVTPLVGRSIDSFGLNSVFTALAFISLASSALVLLIRKKV